MKKLLFFVVFAFLFCSCGVPEPATEEGFPEEILLPKEESSSEPAPENSENQSEAGYRLTTYAGGTQRLESLGISHSASNVVSEEDGRITFDLTLKKGEKEITENFGGYVLSSETCGLHYEWGGYSLTSNGHLALCGINKIIIINPVDFSVIDIKFELEGLTAENRDLWISGVIFDENNENWVVSAAEGAPSLEYPEYMSWRIFVFDKDGKLLSEYNPKASALYGGWRDFATPYTASKCTVLNKGGKTYYSFGAQCYCIDDGKSYRGSSVAEPYEAKTGRYSLYFYHCYNTDYEGEGNGEGYNPGKDLGFYAVLFENENIHSFFSTGDNYMSVSWDRETGKQTLELTHNGRLGFTLENSYLAKTMELDFEKETYSISYNYTDENLAELIDTSADGNYSLWQAAVDAGGESYFYEVALKNNQTGEIKRVAPNGTNIGSHSSEGFLKNGDFYVFSTSGFKIYSPENCEVVFDISENFMSEENGGKKIIHTFRRDPDDFSFIVVYSDASGYSNEDIQKAYDTGTMPYTIKLAFLDKDGNLIEDFDSGVFVNASYFGIQTAEMRYSEDQIMLFSDINGKGYSPFRIVFDLATKTFL